MQKITGRTDDMIILRGVNLFPTQIEELIMGIPALSPHFQLHLTRLLPGTARTMRRIEKITGRTDDMIILRGVNLFPTQVEELILGISALSPHFQLHLSKHGNLDSMTVHVERRPDATPAAAEAAGAQLAGQIKNTIGVSTGIVVEEPDTIERSMGKMRRIIDERPR